MDAIDLSSAATIGEAWMAVRTAFRAAALETADLDARLLTASLAELAPHELATRGDMALDRALRQRLTEAALDRLGGKPVHRILGRRAFYGLPLALSAATLEPRPDTETLVEAALPFVQARAADNGVCTIVDLGVGAGGIGLALLAECARAQCLGIDVSAEAVRTALANANALGLSSRYRAVTGDWLEEINDRFDLIVSNPPYIPTGDLASLSREVVDHDPVLALDGGEDGLSAYRAIATQAAARLAVDGRVVVEIGYDQKLSVTELFAEAGFVLSGVSTDLGGIDRVLMFTR
jgi:release factor glutamine methyltransferase